MEYALAVLLGVCLYTAFILYRYFRRNREGDNEGKLPEFIEALFLLKVPDNELSRGFGMGIFRACCKVFHTQKHVNAAVATGSFGAISYLKRLTGVHPGPLAASIFLKAYRHFVAQLPNYVGTPAFFWLPLRDVLPSRKPVDDFFHFFKRDDEFLWPIYSTYVANHYVVEKAVEKRDYEFESRRWYEGLLQGTGFEYLLDSEVTVTIPQHMRFEGVWIVAPPGRGKTTLLSQFLRRDLGLVADGKASIVVFDSKGEFIDGIRHLKRFAPGGDLHERLVILDPRENLALNPLDLGMTNTQTISLIEYVMSALLGAETTPKQGGILRRVIVAVQGIPDPTFHTMLRFLRNWRQYEQYITKLPPDDREFFTSGAFDEPDVKRTCSELAWRIDSMMTKVPLLRSMFKSASTRIDLGYEIDEGKVIIIDNNADLLGDGQEFFSRFFLALILAEAQHRSNRPDNQKKPCFVYLDEADTVIARDDNTNVLLSKCRSQKFGLVIAHQKLADIESDKVRAALRDCGVKIANSDNEAAALFELFRIDKEKLRTIPKGKFAFFMRDYMREGIVVETPNEKVNDWARMSDAEYAEILWNMKIEYSYIDVPPEEEATTASTDGGNGNDEPSPWG